VLLNYYRKFISNLSALLYPLNNLLQYKRKWKWTEECGKVSKETKKQLATAPVLAHYDLQLPLQLVADASSYEVGAILSHRYSDGSEHPIVYASQILVPNDCNYVQIKEAVALVFGIQKFHQLI